jgi:hypothetical protein
MMFVTLVAVVLGMFTVARGIGFVTLIALVPAGFRYAWVIGRIKQSGAATTLDEKLAVFAASLAMVVVAGVAAAIAFFAVCFGGFFASAAVAPPERYDFLIVGLLIGGAVGIGLAIWLFYRLMKRLAPADSRKPSRWLLFGGGGILIVAALVWWLLVESGEVDHWF